MSFDGELFVDIKNIRIAHKYVLDRVHRCEYPCGRGSYGLIYALQGSAEYRFFTGERLTVCEGEALLLCPDTAYSIVTEKEFKHYTVNFDIHEEGSSLDALSAPYCLLHKDHTEELGRIFKKLIGIYTLKKPGYKMQSVSCLYELLSVFFECLDHKNTSLYQRLLPAKEYIERCFDQTVSLEHLAFLSSMSVTNFRREWKKIYKGSPLQFRDSIRLYYAEEYIKSGYYTISEIAQKCGFDDVSYFVRFFKKHTGVTPGQLKKRFLGK